MIFYHFTYPKFLDAILREGLLPADSRQWMLNGQKVVWLTQLPTLKPTRQAREALLRRGIWFKANSSNLPNATVCLEVRISANDERLKKVVPWMRKHLPSVDDADALLVADDWLYFGVLLPKRLRVHKHVPSGDPYVNCRRTKRAHWMKPRSLITLMTKNRHRTFAGAASCRQEL